MPHDCIFELIYTVGKMLFPKLKERSWVKLRIGLGDATEFRMKVVKMKPAEMPLETWETANRYIKMGFTHQ
jgi:hypothetical protein